MGFEFDPIWVSAQPSLKPISFEVHSQAQFSMLEIFLRYLKAIRYISTKGANMASFFKKSN